METTKNEILTLWQENKDILQAITASTPDGEYNNALALCNRLYAPLRDTVTIDEYLVFLSAYANVLALRDENVEKELAVQEDIVTIRRKQVDTDRSSYLPKLANSLLYAALLHQRLTNVHQATDYMEECVACEREAVEELAVSTLDRLATKCYCLAHLYASTGRNILAEDTYKETIAHYNLLLNKGGSKSNDTTMMLANILVEFADFYYNMKFFDNALDRYQQAIEVLRTLPNEEQALPVINSLYMHLSNVYTLMNDAEKSKHYSDLAQQS